MILGTDGEKMSKSRGNVINPDDVVNEHGAVRNITVDSAQNNSNIRTKRVPQKAFDYLMNSILDRTHK